MCGIHLILDFHGKASPKAIDKMVAASSHRGPDGKGSVRYPWGQKGSLYLGHNLLKIMDLSTEADQPKTDEDGALIFNGEIYNFYEIRNRLIQQNLQLRSSADTEALLKSLHQQGSQLLQQIEGMFALAYFNTKEQKLLVARDFFGIKPLYYFQNADFLILSSEIRAILTSELIQERLRMEAIPEYLLFKSSQDGNSFFEGIKEFPQGKFIELEADKSLGHFQAFERAFQEEPQAPSLMGIEQGLIDSVLNQSNAKVPVGIMLSGGVDSSLLLALSREENILLPSFSIAFQEDLQDSHSDISMARQSARQWGVESAHREILLDESAWDFWDEYLAALDQPVADSAAYLTWSLSREVKQEVKVLLNGAGADELFSGYRRHKAFYFYLQHQKKLLFFKKSLKIAANGIPPWAGLMAIKRNLRHFSRAIHPDAQQSYRSFVQQPEVINWMKKHAIEPLGSASFRYADAWHYDLLHYLPNDLLQVADSMAMRHGVEIRVPYLDQSLFQQMKIKPEWGIEKGQKWVLKHLLNNRGGKKFIQRKKTGFGIGRQHWNKGSKLNGKIHFALEKNSPIFEFLSKKAVITALKQQESGKMDFSTQLWSIVQLNDWLDSRKLS